MTSTDDPDGQRHAGAVHAELVAVVYWDCLLRPGEVIKVDDPTCFEVAFDAMIGPVGSTGCDRFEGMAISASRLEQVLRDPGLDSRLRVPGVLIPDVDVVEAVPLSSCWWMDRWSHEDLVSALRDWCRYCRPAPTWGILANRLAAALDWESGLTGFETHLRRGECDLPASIPRAEWVEAPELDRP